MDVSVFQETTITDGIYTRGYTGYRVVGTSVPIRHHGGVMLFYQDSPNFAVEAIRQFGVNVIACQLATGERRWYIFGYYLASGDETRTWGMEAVMI